MYERVRGTVGIPQPAPRTFFENSRGPADVQRSPHTSCRTKAANNPPACTELAIPGGTEGVYFFFCVVCIKMFVRSAVSPKLSMAFRIKLEGCSHMCILLDLSVLRPPATCTFLPPNAHTKKPTQQLDCVFAFLGPLARSLARSALVRSWQLRTV